MLMRHHAVRAAVHLGLTFLMMGAVVQVVAGCRSGESSSTPSPIHMQRLSGTVTYRQRIALPPDAVVHVVLEDVSQADVPPYLIARAEVPTAGKQVPIAFTLEYDRARIVAGNRYHLRATITSGNAVLFATARGHPVLGAGAADGLEIIVTPARSEAGKPPAGVVMQLQDTQWRLTEINGQAALPRDRPRSAGIMFISRDGTIGANTSINSMGGTFTLKDDALSIEPGMMTMMAGPEPLMQQEQAFIAALKRVTGYRLSGGTLELLAGETTVMKFEVSAPP